MRNMKWLKLVCALGVLAGSVVAEARSNGEVKVVNLSIPPKISPAIPTPCAVSFLFEKLNPQMPLRDSIRGSLRFYHDDLLWHVEDFVLLEEAERLSAGEILTATVDLRFPCGLPAGEYDVRPLVYGAIMDSSTPSGKTTISGPGTAPDARLVKAIGDGSYMDKSGVPHQWWINRQNALIWEGKPWIPFGGMFCTRGRQADEFMLRSIAQNGIKDIYFNVTEIETAKSLEPLMEELGIRYGLQFQSGSPSVWPMIRMTLHKDAKQNLLTYTYRENGKAEFSIPRKDLSAPSITSVDEVYYLVLSSDFETVVDTGVFKKSKLTGNSLDVEGEFKNVEPGKTYQVVCLPRITLEGLIFGCPNYWSEGKGDLEACKQRMKERLVKNKLGPNFRFIVEPGRNELGFNGDLEPGYFPIPKMLELYQKWLEARYGTIASLKKAWKMDEDAPIDFAVATRLVPASLILGDNPKETPRKIWLFDWKTRKTYRAGYLDSHCWLDYIEFRDTELIRSINEICDTVKDVMDVPCVQKHVAVTRRYNINNRKKGGLDGIGFECYQDFDGAYTHHSSNATMEARSSNRTMWVLLTEGSPLNSWLDLNCHWANRPLWISRRDMVQYFDRLFNSGIKGYFHFVISLPLSCKTTNICELYHQPVMQQWMGWVSHMANDRLADQIKEFRSTYYVAFPAGDQWWMPGKWSSFYRPGEGFESIRVFKCPNGVWAVPTDFPERVDAGVYYCNLKNAAVAERFKDAFENLLKRGKRLVYVGHRDADGTLSIDQYFSDKYVTLTDGRIAQELKPPKGARILNKARENGAVFGFEYGNLQIVAAPIWNYPVHNPNEMTPHAHDHPDVYPKVLGTRLPEVNLRARTFTLFDDMLSPSDEPIMQWDFRTLYPAERSGGKYPWPPKE